MLLHGSFLSEKFLCTAVQETWHLFNLAKFVMLQRVVITKYCCTFFALKLVTTKNSHRENFSRSICVLVVGPAVWTANFIGNFVS